MYYKHSSEPIRTNVTGPFHLDPVYCAHIEIVIAFLAVDFFGGSEVGTIKPDCDENSKDLFQLASWTSLNHPGPANTLKTHQF